MRVHRQATSGTLKSAVCLVTAPDVKRSINPRSCGPAGGVRGNIAPSAAVSPEMPLTPIGFRGRSPFGHLKRCVCENITWKIRPYHHIGDYCHLCRQLRDWLRNAGMLQRSSGQVHQGFRQGATRSGFRHTNQNTFPLSAFAKPYCFRLCRLL